jgi:hypothetical protein
LPVHRHYTAEGPIDCHVSDCDVYQIQAAARAESAAAPGPAPDGDPAPGYAEAWEAVTDLLERVYDGTWCQRDSDVMHATLEAAWPVLAAHAAATERERIRQLAIDLASKFPHRTLRSFADLLDGDTP